MNSKQDHKQVEGHKSDLCNNTIIIWCQKWDVMAAMLCEFDGCRSEILVAVVS